MKWSDALVAIVSWIAVAIICSTFIIQCGQIVQKEDQEAHEDIRIDKR
jgi:hypothetical protein